MLRTLASNGIDALRTYLGLVNLGGSADGVPVDAEAGSYTMIFDLRQAPVLRLRPGTRRCGVVDRQPGPQR